MGRTTIDVDDALVAAVMRRYSLSTKREAVDRALRHLVGPVMQRSEMLAMQGSGWEGYLDSPPAPTAGAGRPRR
ncbi:type II toxin-antitoxin system VapB family antitoxin [Yimella sp. cx-51]|uniref:type II toxin-antitoxin system VapB family antitoxin n=1 Tax=Yimella sp. cx-51 TaxID=2770551 RepID=UPI00165D3090|nr:type II toxin-antitoxin system VapB family antitoxin [Yimella sp. cx-51]MBC9958242.1 type II toxin-antitoxin system VapB family antitoxin [Yimella sp. cx-51]MBD2758885.1 type II toxin-antitoxin system VapB family antitoxin [Yimella sp. cx-573]QTH38729.1 type II toxin-antitoxin system VapB family antitoxin [Yimella sp. cx-51]